MNGKNRSGFRRRHFLAGAAACGGALLTGRVTTAKASETPLTHGRLFNLCHLTHPTERVCATVTLPSGASAIDVFRPGPDGTPVTRQARFPSTGSGPGQFNFPQGMAVDDEGNLFVVDCNNGRIQVVLLPKSAEGTIAPVRSLCTLGPKPGQLHSPQGVAFRNGLLYVADTRNHRLQILRADTGSVALVVGEHGTAVGQFRSPTDVAVDEEGIIAVTDAGNNRVQLFSAFTGTRGAEPYRTITGVGSPNPVESFIAPLVAVAARDGSFYVLESSAGRETGAVTCRLIVLRREEDFVARPLLTKERFAQAGIERPFGLCLGRRGRVWVGDRATGLVHELREDA